MIFKITHNRLSNRRSAQRGITRSATPSFGWMPYEKSKTLLPLKQGDIVVIDHGQRRNPEVKLSSSFVQRLKYRWQKTGGLVAMENVMPFIEQALKETHQSQLDAQKVLRVFTLSVSDRLSQLAAGWPPLKNNYAGAKPHYGLKVAYDTDRRGTNPKTRHIHHGHFDPDYYKVIGLLDGPFTNIEPGKHNRLVIDVNEVKRLNGPLPSNFAKYSRYITPEEEKRFGIEYNSQQGSLVFHTQNRFIHWVEGEGGATLENWTIIDPYKNREAGDDTRTPYGFIGFIDPFIEHNRYKQARKKITKQRLDFIRGAKRSTKPSHF
jgi:hypothetical protein